MLLLLSLAFAAPVDDPHTTALLGAGRNAGTHAWDRLARLCDDVGARPAGSLAYARAVELVRGWLAEDGLSPRVEPVPVNVWVRGAESLVMVSPQQRTLPVLGLGGSVGTPGIEAPVSVVHSFDELGPQVAGKIVVFDVPMPEGTPAVEQYGATVRYRYQGAERAAAFGAVATLVRSVTTRSLVSPHTGGMSYGSATNKIPSAAISVEDAAQLSRLAARGVEVRLQLKMEAHDAGTATDANVIGEVRGKERPNEVVVIGAHLDSWDVGQGAQDDGAGVVEVIEALRQIKAHGTPRRTIRVVLFANEEHGLDGGKAYAAAHSKERHVAAIESDLGGGKPLRFEASGNAGQLAWLATAAAPVGLPVGGEGGGADIGPLADHGALLIGLLPDDSHYFDIHHTHADTVEKIDPANLGEAIGSIAALAWRLADAPGEAPVGTPAAEKRP